MNPTLKDTDPGLRYPLQTKQQWNVVSIVSDLEAGPSSSLVLTLPRGNKYEWLYLVESEIPERRAVKSSARLVNRDLSFDETLTCGAAWRDKQLLAYFGDEDYALGAKDAGCKDLSGIQKGQNKYHIG